MSAFAGVFSRAKDPSVLRTWRPRLRAALEGQANGQPLEVCESGIYYALKYDAGAYGTPGLLTKDSNVALLAGHPYFDSIHDDDRRPHLEFFARGMHGPKTSHLADARGSYAAAYITEDAHKLVLVADTLGVRPLYFLSDEEKVIFSTTLATFELLSGLELLPDERGMIEAAAFGFYVGDTTRYSNVRCVRGGHAVVFTATASETSEYWRWDGREIQSLASEDSLRLVFDKFIDAIGIRLANDRGTAALLTGGLDSRCVAAALRERHVEVQSLNFAPPNSQDLVFGRLLAQALGTHHTELEVPSLPHFADKLAWALPRWVASLPPKAAERPQLVWSGDGGSVALGHVYLTPEMVAHAERGAWDAALLLMLRHNTWHVPRIMRSSRANMVANYLLESLKAELERISCADPGRALHVLLMNTDQRGHLHPYYERIFEHRCEFHLPFFDRDFLTSILTQPVGPFLLHRFYNDWLELFSPEARLVPWQAYPGHVPCPVPVPSNLSYQWAPDQATTSADKKRSLCFRVLRNALTGRYRDTPASAIKLAGACAITLTNLRDFSYALNFAEALPAPRSTKPLRAEPRAQ